MTSLLKRIDVVTSRYETEDDLTISHEKQLRREVEKAQSRE
jgi:hypothetical protein